MGIMKWLFGSRVRPRTKPENRGFTEAVVEGAPAEPMWHRRRQARDWQVEWPVDPATGTVFDDDWLLDGLIQAVNENQYRATLEARDMKARLRRERLYTPGLDGVDQAADMLRGRDWLEWSEHVYQMKRDGFLESALALVYEMIDVAGRSPSYNDHKVPPGWYMEAAIILRRMKRREEEIGILRAALSAYPGDSGFSARLAKVQMLLAKE